ncbi:MAG: peptidase M17 [Treponema sp.]|nr:peptidase M17 [Treponema sp.]
MKGMTPAQTIVFDVCKIKKGERVLIVANPEMNLIAQDIFEAAIHANAEPVLIYQRAKTSFDNAAPEVIAAIASNPDACISVSSIKLGKDEQAAAHPYVAEDGAQFDHVFDYLLAGKKSMRAVWMPGITQDMYERTVQIDYAQLAARCARIEKLYEGVASVHVTSPAGTDVVVPVKGRKAMSDNGDFSKPGLGGNMPAGEVFISPVVGSGPPVPSGAQTCKSLENGNDAELQNGTSGVIVFDGSMTFGDGDALLKTPITVKIENGFVTDVSGGEEAARLKKTITDAEVKALALEKEGKLPKGMGAAYKKNARNIGELGIGLNPAAAITGNMLEDEKAFRTCHFAIGENYDNDAPALIHLDGVVKNPTIVFTYEDGSECVVLDDGVLQE